MIFQFTKQGSVLVCVRAVDESEPLVEEHLNRVSSVSSGFKISRNKIAENPDPSLANGLSGDLRSWSSQATDSQDHQNSCAPRDSLVLPDSAPPRLSLKPGFLSTREAVDDWRNWKFKTSTGEDNGVCTIVQL
jgi:hypothetical protein